MFHYYLSRATFFWKKILVVLLLGLSAYGLYEAARFFLVELPELEHALTAHEASPNHIQELISGALAESVISGINIFFAVRLHKVSEKIIQIFDLISSSSLVVLHNTVVEWLSAINYVAFWQRFW